MRADMFKVIVERPRNWKSLKASVRAPDVSEEAAGRAPMRPRRTGRILNENLNPLERFLHSQVNRPWNKVYSDLREHIDARSTVKHHILQHLDDFVASRSRVRDGAIWVASRDWSEDSLPLQRADQPLYVHPVTGILLRNPHPGQRRIRYRAQREDLQAKVLERRRELSESEQLLRLDGQWYRVTLGKLGRNKNSFQREWCAVRKAIVSMENSGTYGGDDHLGNTWLFGKDDLYAVTKRQLGRRDLRAHGLQ